MKSPVTFPTPMQDQAVRPQFPTTAAPRIICLLLSAIILYFTTLCYCPFPPVWDYGTPISTCAPAQGVSIVRVWPDFDPLSSGLQLCPTSVYRPFNHLLARAAGISGFP